LPWIVCYDVNLVAETGLKEIAMKFDWSASINNVPLTELRLFLRWNFSPSEITFDSVDGILDRELRRKINTLSKIPHPQWDMEKEKAKLQEHCQLFIEALLAGGFIKVFEPQREDITYYTITELGNHLWHSRLRRYTHAAAEKQLNILLENCRMHNARKLSADDPLSFCSIRSVTVFGSYMRGEKEVGDVDVIIDVSIRDKRLYDKYMRKMISTTPLYQIATRSPEVQVLRHIKKGLNIIGLSTIPLEAVPVEEVAVYKFTECTMRA
jgi:hypothetical protein